MLPLEDAGSTVLRSEAMDIQFPWKGQPLADLFKTLRDVMKREGGIGLAAPQVGIPLKLAVIQIGHDYLELINPKVLKAEGAPQVVAEGCLSLPGKEFRIKRFLRIRGSYQTRAGDTVVEDFSGLWAQAFQHETQHLYGNLIDSRS